MCLCWVVMIENYINSRGEVQEKTVTFGFLVNGHAHQLCSLNKKTRFFPLLKKESVMEKN